MSQLKLGRDGRKRNFAGPASIVDGRRMLAIHANSSVSF